MPAKKARTKKTLNLILLGDPGAGKATQAAYFAKKYDMYDFDMGRELTLLREKNRRASKELEKNYDKGSLAPTVMVRQIINEKFSKLPKSKNLLLDGFPKMLGEARIISKLMKHTNRSNIIVCYIRIPQDEVVKRVLHRKGYADTKFSKRLHDTEEGLKNRAKYYRINIQQVKKFFAKNYPFFHIDGTGTRTQVRARIQKIINDQLK
jgi:adenylate kinase